MRSRPINIVLADAGPLITFAAVNRLDLLHTFQRPVLVADVVHAECLHSIDKIGYKTLLNYFDGLAAPRPEVVETTHIAEYKRLIDDTAATYEDRADLGEKAIAEVIAQRHAADPNTLQLVVTEDGGAGDTMAVKAGVEVALLSTRALLLELENRGAIGSAKGFLESVAEQGRNVSRYTRDQPIRDSKRRPVSNWRLNLPTKTGSAISED